MTFSFHLMPLGFTIEQTTTTEQAQIVAKKPKRVVFTVRLPKWFCQQQYDLQLQRASSGWTYTLGFCRIVPSDSPFFIACQEGRIDEVKKLLSSGQASIYDRDEANRTALYGAILGRRLDVCTLLRREGIFRRLQHDDLQILLTVLAIASLGPIESEKSLYRSITPPGYYDEDWVSELFGENSMQYRGLILLSDVYAQSGTEKLDQLDLFLLTRMEIWIYYLGQNKFAPFGIINSGHCLAEILGDNAVFREIEASPSAYKWVVHAISWANTLRKEASYEEEYITTALALAIQAGMDLHQPTDGLPFFWRDEVMFESSFHGDLACEALKSTPLGATCLHWLTLYATQHHCFSSPKHFVRFINERLHCWISSVHSRGIDIVQYSAREAPQIRKYLRLYASIWWNGGHTFTLSVGPHATDWHLSLWEPCETYARHFWQLMTGESVLDHIARGILVRKSAMNTVLFDDADMPGAWRDGCHSAVKQLQDSLMISDNFVLDSMESDLLNFSDEAFFKKYEEDDGMWKIDFIRLWYHGYTGRGDKTHERDFFLQRNDE